MQNVIVKGSYVLFGRDFEVYDTSKQHDNVYKHSLGFLITGVYNNPV